MKKAALIITIIITATTLIAQPPQTFTYQAVVRNNAGDVMQNQTIGIRISIHDTTASGLIVYQETFSGTTNQFGLVNLDIGNGTPTIGTFTGIDWGNASKFIETEIDATGGTAYVSMGTSELLSVPYALYSGAAGNTSMWQQNGDTIYYYSGNVGIGTTSPQGEFHVNNPYEWTGITFNGSGPNDLDVNYSAYNGTGMTNYIAEVTNAGPNPNIFRWSNDNGTTWTDNVQMALSGIDVGKGVTIGFGGLNGHAFGDKWLWTVSESYMNGLIVKNGKVGIGKDNPITQLDVNGEINISNNSIYKINNVPVLSNRGTKNIFVGDSVAQNNTGYSNAYVGYQCGYNNTTGYVNSFMGFRSGYSNTSGAANTFMGYISGFKNTIGGANTIIGDRSGYYNTEGNRNCYLGYKSGFSNSTGSNNVGIGYKSLYYNTGDENTAIGYAALYKNSTGFDNTAYGFGALYSNTSGVENTASGHSALYNNTEGGMNTAMGTYALTFNIIGWANTAIGYYALKHNTDIRNTACGAYALHGNTTGAANTSVGYRSLYQNYYGSYNTAVGDYAFSTGTSYSNSSAIGFSAWPGASNKIIFGNNSITWIGGNSQWYNTSDERVKNNIQEDVQGINFIMELRPVTYYFDKDKMDELTGVVDSSEYAEKYDVEKIKHSGFLAQEVEKAAIRAGYDFSGVCKPSGDVKYYSLAYAEFVVPLVKGMQEQQAMIEDMQVLIKELKSHIEELERKK